MPERAPKRRSAPNPALPPTDRRRLSPPHAERLRNPGTTRTSIVGFRNDFPHPLHEPPLVIELRQEGRILRLGGDMVSSRAGTKKQGHLPNPLHRGDFKSFAVRHKVLRSSPRLRRAKSTARSINFSINFLATATDRFRRISASTLATTACRSIAMVTSSSTIGTRRLP